MVSPSPTVERALSGWWRLAELENSVKSLGRAFLTVSAPVRGASVITAAELLERRPGEDFGSPAWSRRTPCRCGGARAGGRHRMLAPH